MRRQPGEGLVVVLEVGLGRFDGVSLEGSTNYELLDDLSLSFLDEGPLEQFVLRLRVHDPTVAQRSEVEEFFRRKWRSGGADEETVESRSRCLRVEIVAL